MGAMEEIKYSHEQNKLFAACIYSSVREAIIAEAMERAAKENEQENAEKSA